MDTLYIPTLSEQAALDQLQAKIDHLFNEKLGGIPFTRANFLALIRSALGTPYRLGGVDPFHGGADCSGLIWWAANQCVDANGNRVDLPRTTTAEWAGLPHVVIPQPGDCPEFDVPGDHEPEPAHVGVYVGPGTMIDDPHTGAVVRQEGIPNEPGVIWVLGYVTLPFIAPVPVPTPAPIIHTGGNDVSAHDDKTGGIWATDANGDLYPAEGAPYINALSAHPEYKAGAAESGGANPCVGVEYWAAFGNDGIVFLTAPTNGQGGWDGSTPIGAVPYDLYRFLRNGNVALKDGTVLRPHPTKADEWEPTGETVNFASQPAA